MTGPSPGAKADELALWAALLEGKWPRYAGIELGIAPKRVQAICEKWSRQRIYDYGVVCDLGWPEPLPEGWQLKWRDWLNTFTP